MLESFEGRYEEQLFVSLARKPTSLTVWMLNRIINGESSSVKRTEYIAAMKDLLHHPQINCSTREETIEFLRHQRAL